MPANVLANTPTYLIALQTISFSTMGLDGNKVAIIHQDGASPKNWVPGRGINGITGTTAGKGYQVNSKIDLDLSTWFAPPVPSSGGAQTVAQLFNS